MRARRYSRTEVEAELVPEAVVSQAAGHTNGLLLLHPAPSGFAVSLAFGLHIPALLAVLSGSALIY